MLLLSATDTEAGQCREQAAMVAAVAFFYGDEFRRSDHGFVMRKVMLALIGEPPSSPSPEPLPRPLSDPMKPGRRGSTFDEDLADNLTQLDRVRWVVGHSL